MPTPNNKQLYENVKKKVYRRIPKHSAYRSAQVVKEYKNAGGTYSGDRTKGKLTRWFDEEWKNQRGGEGYKRKGDYYRPTKKISKDTPTTHKELTSTEKKKASNTKAQGKRIKQFKNRSPYKIKKRQRRRASELGYRIEPSKRKLKKIAVYDKKTNKFIADIGGMKEDGSPYRDYASILESKDKATADKIRNAYITRHASEPKKKPDGSFTKSKLADIILWS